MLCCSHLEGISYLLIFEHYHNFNNLSLELLIFHILEMKCVGQFLIWFENILRYLIFMCIYIIKYCSCNFFALNSFRGVGVWLSG